MTEEVRKDISEAAVKVSEYIHEQKFDAILVSGGSNQLSRSLFTLAWQSRFPGEPMPTIYKFNKGGNNILYKSDLDTASVLSQADHWIEQNLPQLNNMKDDKLCYLDDFAMTGGKYVLLKRRFDQLGFHNVSFAFFGATELSEIDKEVFVGTLNMDTNRELQLLSLEIQGRSSFRDLREGIEKTADENRREALDLLKGIGKEIRTFKIGRN